MAGNMFLALTNILGESMDVHHKMEIEVVDWTWSMSNSASFRIVDTNAAKQPTINGIVITKMVDKASTTLMTYCANGKKIDEGTLTCRKHDGDEPVEFLKIKLTGVKVDALGWTGKNEDNRGIPETVTLSFLQVQVICEVQRRDGSLVGPNEFHFDVPEQKAAAVAGAGGGAAKQ
jgi:type VI secretion system secreted protein Hcp